MRKRFKTYWRPAAIPPDFNYPPIQPRLPWPFDALPQFADKKAGGTARQGAAPLAPPKGEPDGPPCNDS